MNRLLTVIHTRMILMTSFCIVIGCEGYLDLKPDKKMSIPSTLNDIQLMLDDYNAFNNAYPAVMGIMSDDFYLTDSDWTSLTNAAERAFYRWETEENTTAYWNPLYQHIFTLNVILEELPTIPREARQNSYYNMLYGSALFYRAYYYHALLNLFCKPYHEATAHTDLGVPLRLSPDHSVRTSRPSVRDVYDRIIADLQYASSALPVMQESPSRPTKAAAFGTLAKIFLGMGKYEQAAQYADSCLQLSSELMDFSLLDRTSQAPIHRFNREVIFQHRSVSPAAMASSRAKVDTSILSTYGEGDLRPKIFFSKNVDDSYSFKGDYDGQGLSGSGYVFSGITTNEIYLIRAESRARLGNLDSASNDLNRLLISRFESGGYSCVRFETSFDAVKMILEERRKELFFRDSRWLDIRRLALDPVFALAPIRRLNDETFTISPNEPYILLIPAIVIERSGIHQN